MSVTLEGKIEIPAEDFWEFVEKYNPAKDLNCAYGVPKFNTDNDTIDITFAADSMTDPREWIEQPKCLEEWRNK